MMRKLSIYHVLVALLTFSLIIPAGLASAEESESGSLTIHKFEQEPDSEQGNGDGSELPDAPDGTPLSGVTFTLTQTHSYNAATDEWKEVSSTETEYVTGDNGKIHISDIDLGRYKVQETNGPAHVNLNEDEFFVDIPMTNTEGTSHNYDVHIYPKNETIRGAVELIKVDGETNEPLAGVQFDLYDTADQKLNEQTLTTDADGKIQVDGLPWNHEGNYFKEVETVGGYVLGGTVPFTIEESGHFEDTEHMGTVVEVTAKNYQEPKVIKEVDTSAVNRGEEVTYTISVDLPADIKEYKHFVVTDELHENLEFVSEGAAPNGFAFDRNGQTLTWTATPADLEPGIAEITFKAKVKEDAPVNVGVDNVATIDYTNKHNHTGEKETEPITVTPTAGTLVVVKQDGNTEKTLKGAEFDLRYKDGSVYKSGTTNEDGKIDFGEVDYGLYDLVETKAPEGYSKLRNAIEVEVNVDSDEQTIKVDNYKSGWELPKTGGIGTLLFTIGGLLLMSGALYLYIRRKRGEVA